MSTNLQLETDQAMAQMPEQKQWPTDECATVLKIPKVSDFQQVLPQQSKLPNVARDMEITHRAVFEVSILFGEIFEVLMPFKETQFANRLQTTTTKYRNIRTGLFPPALFPMCRPSLALRAHCSRWEQIPCAKQTVLVINMDVLIATDMCRWL